MSSKRRVIGALIAGCLIGGLVVVPATKSSGASGPVFAVMNTSETPPDGVYFRNSPDWSDTSRTYGLGVFANEQIQIQCYASGQAIGPYSDSLWYYVLNVTRPANYDGAANQGMLNAHYVNDGQQADVVDAGVPACVNNLPPTQSAPSSPPAVSGPPPLPAPAPTTAPDSGSSVPSNFGNATPAPTPGPQSPSQPAPAPAAPKSMSVFYSPNGVSTGVAGLTLADQNVPAAQWTDGVCGTGNAVNAVDIGLGTASTLAGWSAGRLGPIYFLDTASSAQIARVHRIILFDPGNTGDFAPESWWSSLLGSPTCDWRFPIPSLLANWLQSDPANHLTLIIHEVA